MKIMKYLLVGVLAMASFAPVAAQDIKADVAAITKVINDAKGDPVALKEPVKTFLKSYKKNPVALAALGRAYLDVRDVDNAKLYADMAMARNKKCVDAYLLMGDIEAVKDDGGAAASWYQQATFIDPNEPMGYIKYARVYRKISPAESAAMLENLRKVRPDYPVDAVAAHFFFQAQQYDQAIAHFGKANIGSLNEDQLKEFSLAGYYGGDYDKALEIAKYGLGQYPRSAVLNRMAFYNSLVKQNYPDALLYSDRLMNQSDSAVISARDYMNLGHTQQALKSYDAAIAAFQKSNELRENNDLLKSIAMCYSAKGDHANAVSKYEEYMTKVTNPKNEDYSSLADIYQAIADDENTSKEARVSALKKADAQYAKLCEKNPNAKFYVYKRATINQDMDSEENPGLAKPYFDKLIEMVNSSDTKGQNDITYLKRSYRYLTVYYYHKKDLATAKDYARKLQELDPENDVAKQILAL